MAFENIDVNSFRSVINSCKNSINYSGTEGIIQTISNDNNWNTLSRNTFKNALNGLINTQYSSLIKKLDDYLTALGYIESYKKLATENSGYRGEISKLSNEIATAKSSTYVVQRGDTMYKIARENGTSVDAIMAVNTISDASVIYVGQQIVLPGGTDVSGLKSQVSNLESLISQNNTQMESLKNKAYALI